MFYYLKNLHYFLKHKYYVAKECFRYGEYWLGITHDISKLSPYEFFAYAHSFYTKPFPDERWHGDVRNQIPYSLTESGVREAFDKAWLHHQNVNKHHWQYWLLKRDDGSIEALEMPIKYVKEMVSDWIGAGIAIKGKKDIQDWYKKNKEKMILHPRTRRWVEWELREDKND
jgi:hypothetical protein